MNKKLWVVSFVVLMCSVFFVHAGKPNSQRGHGQQYTAGQTSRGSVGKVVPLNNESFIARLQKGIGGCAMDIRDRELDGALKRDFLALWAWMRGESS